MAMDGTEDERAELPTTELYLREVMAAIIRLPTQ